MAGMLDDSISLIIGTAGGGLRYSTTAQSSEVEQICPALSKGASENRSITIQYSSTALKGSPEDCVVLRYFIYTNHNNHWTRSSDEGRLSASHRNCLFDQYR
jgi:hypothetical protein